MDQTREERMQQRLRGAVRRQIKDVDFGLSLPAAPSIPAASSPPPIAIESVDVPQTPHLPAPTAQSSNSEAARTALTQGTFDANTSAKRRKLDSDTPVGSSVGRRTRSSRSTPRDDNSTVAEDALLDHPPSESALPVEAVDESLIREEESINQLIAEDLTPSVQPTPSVHFAEDTTIISVDGRTGVEPVRETPREDTVTRLGDVDSPSPSSDIETPVPTKKRKRGSFPTADDDADELSPEQSTKSARGKIIIASERLGDSDPLSDTMEAEEAEEVDDQEAAAILGKNNQKRQSLASSVSSGVSEDSNDTDLPQAKRRRGRPRLGSNRSEQRQPKKTTSKAQTSKKRSAKPKIRLGSPIPVTVHRLTEAPVYDENESDVDILNAEIPNAKRAGVNSIDVLRQICEEMFESTLDTLEEGRKQVDGAARKAYLAKWQAIDSFADEVYARLVEHTINLDNTHALERRVKAENKKKLQLREEILRIRAEREKIALRMDEIRVRHEDESTTANEVKLLNTSLNDIELAVERGRQHQEETSDDTTDPAALEMQLRQVVSLSSKKGAGGGVLQQLKDFNDFLERTALTLETIRE